MGNCENCFRYDATTYIYHNNDVYQVPVYAVKKGDILCSKNGTIYGKVKIVIVSKIGKTMCGDFTPWHPIFHNNHWIPANQFFLELPTDKEASSHVYNFMLEKTSAQHAIDIGITPTKSILFGHGVNIGHAKHEYYSDWDKVNNDLKDIDGYEAGCITISMNIRDADSGLVCKLI